MFGPMAEVITHLSGAFWTGSGWSEDFLKAKIYKYERKEDHTCSDEVEAALDEAGSHAFSIKIFLSESREGEVWENEDEDSSCGS